MSLILASQSQSRQTMLRNAGVPFVAQAAHVDEETLRDGLVDRGTSPRNIADALAEAKALKISLTHGDALVLGSDQILETADGSMLSKAPSPDAAKAHLQRLSGQRHTLHSAAVIAENGEPIWRALESVTMIMRPLSDSFIDQYVAANWESIRYCVGCYQIEGAGAQLFARIDGSHFAILGMPLFPVLGFLRERGMLQK
ncbi:MAG: nucleoside triphosphate pyrophosphatase [Pseudomonadota bacterium]